MTEQETQLQTLEQKVVELISRYRTLQSENAELRNRVDSLTEENQVLSDKNQRASRKVLDIIGKLQNFTNNQSGN